jgi:16S rRNA (guanine527-N7)-methyltransferase
MDTARIATLLEPFLEQPPVAFQLEQISTYIDLLMRWNARINLTAVRHEEEIVTRHFGESFFLARHLFPASAKPCPLERIERSEGPASSVASDPPQEVLTTPPSASLIAHLAASRRRPPQVLDIGSGAGFPALPLKLWAPEIHLTLIESNNKKAAFLREVARTLTLTDINVIAGRAETLAATLGPQAEVVTLRAVERFETILPSAVTFLAPKAALALLIGTAQLPYLATRTTLQWHPPIPIPQSHSRVLSIGIHDKSGG